MNPVNFKGQNSVFKAPEEMSSDQCGDLPACVLLGSYGLPVIISVWQLSDEEMEVVKSTGKITLSVAGRSMPPVLISAGEPFE